MTMFDIRNSETMKDTVDVYIYSDIHKSYRPDADSMWADKFRKELDNHKDAKNINVYLNSPGGSVDEGVAIYSMLKRHNAYVTAYIDGMACSIASVIPMAADKVVMSDCASLMIHRPWSWTIGNSIDMRKAADDLDDIMEACIIPAYKSKTNGKISDELLRQYIDEEKYLNAKQCIEYGFCDEILEKKSPKEEVKEEYAQMINSARTEFMNRFGNMRAAMLPKDEQPAPSENEEKEKPEEQPDEEEAKKIAEFEAKKTETQAKIEEAKKQFLSYFKIKECN